MQLSDDQVDAVCKAYLAMMERFEEVSAAQQRMVASLSRPSRPGVEWMKDHVRDKDQELYFDVKPASDNEIQPHLKQAISLTLHMNP